MAKLLFLLPILPSAWQNRRAPATTSPHAACVTTSFLLRSDSSGADALVCVKATNVALPQTGGRCARTTARHFAAFAPVDRQHRRGGCRAAGSLRLCGKPRQHFCARAGVGTTRCWLRVRTTSAALVARIFCCLRCERSAARALCAASSCWARTAGIAPARMALRCWRSCIILQQAGGLSSASLAHIAIARRV